MNWVSSLSFGIVAFLAALVVGFLLRQRSSGGDGRKAAVYRAIGIGIGTTVATLFL